MVKWLVYCAYGDGSSGLYECYNFRTTVLNCEIMQILKVDYLEIGQPFFK